MRKNRKILNTIVSAVAILLVFSAAAFGDTTGNYSSETRISSAPLLGPTIYPYPKIVQDNDQNLHIAYVEQTSPGYTISYTHNTPENCTDASIWQGNTSNAYTSIAYPIDYLDMCVTSDNKIHLTWQENNKIMYVYSSDSGMTWSSPATIASSSTASMQYPTIAASGTTVKIAFVSAESTTSQDNIMVYDLDSGIAAMVCSEPWASGHYDYPSVAVKIDGTYAVVWEKVTSTYYHETHFYCSRSGFRGLTTYAADGNASNPKIYIGASEKWYIVYVTDLGGTEHLYYSAVDNSGTKDSSVSKNIAGSSTITSFDDFAGDISLTGKLHLSYTYLDSTTAMNLAVGSGRYNTSLNAWEGEGEIYSTSHDYYFSDICSDQHDNSYVVFYNHNSHYILFSRGDYSGPDFSLIAPRNGYATNESNVPLSWSTADDLLSSVASYEVQISSNSTTTNLTTHETSFLCSTHHEASFDWLIRAYDSYGNRSVSETRTFIVDQTAPVVPTPADPANAEAIGYGSQITFTWEGAAADPNLDDGTVRPAPAVTLYITNESNSYAITGLETMETYTYDNTLPEGLYSWHLTAADSAGNASQSISQSFRIDTTAPSVEVIRPINNEISTEPNIGFSGMVTEDYACIRQIELLVYSDASLTTLAAQETIYSSSVAAVEEYRINYHLQATLPNGTYWYKITTLDQVLNSGTFSDASWNFTIAAPAPEVSMTYPLATSTTIDAAGVTFTGTVEDTNYSITLIALDVYNCSDLSTPAATEVIYRYATNRGNSITFYAIDYDLSATLPNGTYQYQILTKNSAGIEETHHDATWTFTVNRIAPEVEMTSPVNLATINDAHPTFQGTIRDNVSNVTYLAINILGGTYYTTLVATEVIYDNSSSTVSEYAINHTLNQHLPAGTYQYTFYTRDSSGNTDTQADEDWRFTRGNTITSNYPIDGEVIDSNNITVRGTLSDGANDIYYLAINLLSGESYSTLAASEVIYNDAATPIGDYTINYALPTDLANATYAYTFVTRDTGGAEETQSDATWYFIKNRTDDDAPRTTCTLNDTAVNDWYNNADLALTLSARDSGTGSSSIQTSYTLSNLTTSTNTTALAAYTSPITVAVAADGQYQLTYFSVDGENNVEATQSLTFKYDATPLSAISSISTASYDATSATLQWTNPYSTADLATPDYYIIYSAQSEITADTLASAASTNVDATTSTLMTAAVSGLDLANHKYYFAIKSVDEAGNVSDLSANVSADALIDRVSRLDISPVSASIQAGSTQIFTATAYDASGIEISGLANNIIFTLPNTAAGSIASDGTFTASNTLGTYSVRAYLFNNAGAIISTLATVSIYDLTEIATDQTSVSLACGASTSVAVSAVNSLGADISDLSAYAISASVDTESGITLNYSNGTLTIIAGSTTGTYPVTLTYTGIEGTVTASITVTVTAADAATLTLGVDTAATMFLTYGDSYSFTATSTDTHGNIVATSTSTIDTTAWTGDSPYGEKTYTVSLSGLSSAVAYTVIPNVTSIELSTASAVIAAGEQLSLSFVATDSRGTSLSISDLSGYGMALSWSTTGGSVSSSGLFTAPSADGKYTVTVSYTNADAAVISDSIEIQVSSGGPTITVSINDTAFNASNNYIVNDDSSVAIDISDANAVNTSTVTVTLDGTALAEGSGLSIAAVGASVDSLAISLSAATISGLADGSHTLTVSATDLTGAARSTSVTFTVYGSLSVIGTPMNYPNPFSPANGTSTTIRYNLTQDADIIFMIYDIVGNRIYRWSYSAGATGGSSGQNEITWNGISDFGTRVGNGVYIYFILSGAEVLGSGEMAVYN